MLSATMYIRLQYDSEKYEYMLEFNDGNFIFQCRMFCTEQERDIGRVNLSWKMNIASPMLWW